LTRDNLEKRKKLDDNRCLFCNELETVVHPFFECCVARLVWNEIAEISGKVIGADFESVARFWVADKKCKVLNVCSAAAFWAIWKLRNEFCFQGEKWSGAHILLRRIARMLRDWRLLNKAEAAGTLEAWVQELEARSCRPPRLMWEQGSDVSCDVELGSDVVSRLSAVSVECSDNIGGECIVQDAGRFAVPDGRLVPNV
jgi:hypothetical protein